MKTKQKEPQRRSGLSKSTDWFRGSILGDRQLGEVFGRIRLELGFAAFAAEFHFLTFVNQYGGFPHGSQLGAGNDARLQGIGFHTVFGGNRFGVSRIRHGGSGGLGIGFATLGGIAVFVITMLMAVIVVVIMIVVMPFLAPGKNE